MVEVTPLQPPFTSDVVHFEFRGWDKILTVSREDGERINALFSGKAEGRDIVLEATEDGQKIKVMVSQ
jgi:hypothetical protein